MARIGRTQSTGFENINTKHLSSQFSILRAAIAGLFKGLAPALKVVDHTPPERREPHSLTVPYEDPGSMAICPKKGARSLDG